MIDELINEPYSDRAISTLLEAPDKFGTEEEFAVMREHREQQNKTN